MLLISDQSNPVVTKYAGQVKVKPSNCFRRLKNKFYRPFLTQVFHAWWCETCRVIQQQFRMEECDILREGRNILWPLLHIFRGSRPPNLRILAAGLTYWLCGHDSELWSWSHREKLAQVAVVYQYHARHDKMWIFGAARHWSVLVAWLIRILSLSPAVCIQQSATLALIRTLTQTPTLTITLQWSLICRWALEIRELSSFWSAALAFCLTAVCEVPGSTRAVGSCVYRKNHCDLQPWARAVCTLPAWKLKCFIGLYVCVCVVSGKWSERQRWRNSGWWWCWCIGASETGRWWREWSWHERTGQL